MCLVPAHFMFRKSSFGPCCITGSHPTPSLWSNLVSHTTLSEKKTKGSESDIVVPAPPTTRPPPAPPSHHWSPALGGRSR